MTWLFFTILALDLVFLGLVLWNALAWPSLGGDLALGTLSSSSDFPPLASSRVCSVLIPARDEAANIGACLASVLAQDRVLEVVVYDDHSTDRTAELVHEAALADPRVRAIPGVDLPPDWFGKPFACLELARAARGEWLLFLDADARLAPDAVQRAIRGAESQGASFLSCWPGLELVGFWEKALMPLLNFVVFTLYPAPLAFSRRDPALGLAHGACMLIRRDEYERTGGHEMVRQEIFEDTRLARAWRERGLVQRCVDGRNIVRARMYGGLGEIWAGFRKNFRPAFRRELSFWLFLAFHALCFVAPFFGAPFLSFLRPSLAWVAWLAVGAVLLARAVQALRFRYPLWSVFLHPLAEVMLIALGLASRRAWRGGGVAWKGRRYQADGAVRGPEEETA
jgi:glycosyltransferase involved in cell wall biosynthesis